ncbi:xanthine dehydrogenase family protein molybdopterin-binding subunit [Acidaminobacter hydrogenoformans]|uniref:Xanthine dehydrogenase, molybdenum binding subunit apoprotein n=1 Tax=Acidaminobacter hydrogenoformans DSM 2784 TaxID=1120920 RepID=A0A1G5RW38_9FIRM|nr:xanthine dehydrogenase family protein molybdopterin-binding subunit [Acidaminobacter hydrogenoformans]SCZ78266.1 xanthine dehydrogenase, molybdenum binding subunit apoprotein [Acidaminobacter hydrogenoformans DSM 2784]
MKFVGKSIKRVDGVKKVTGSLKYVDDMKMPRMLYVAVKRSPHPHARIVSIDTSKAISLKGVKDVITGEYYTKRGGLYLEDKNFLAVGKARYRGEAVAAVAAESEDIAKAAAELIEVDYEVLPAVTNAIEAMAPNAPLVHPDLGDYKVAPVFFPEPGTNISNHYKLRKGDAEKGFSESDYVFENKFYVPHVQHVPIETHTAIAQMDADGYLTVWASCQSPYAVRQALSAAFDVPLNKLRVISPAVGGGFGSKAGTTLEGIIIPLAMRSNGRPVKLTYSREDEFENAYVRQGLHATIKTGVRKDGKILAVQNEFIWDGGAYTEYGVNIVKAAGYASAGPYDIDNVFTDSYCVYTNHPVGGPYRGFGMSEIHFGIEQNLDIVAEQIGITPVEIRKINGLKSGGRTGTGEIVEVSGLIECLDNVIRDIELDKVEPASGPNKRRGKAIACGWKAPSMPNNAASSAIIKLNEDGTAHLLVSAQDIGQGSDTVMTQIAAEVLSISPEKITVRTGDTDHTPYEWQTVASRITYSAGRAVFEAAQDAKAQLFELAQIKLGVYKRDLEMRDGFIVSKIYPDRKVAISELALGLTFEDGSGVHGPIIGRGAFIPPNIRNADKKTGLGDHPVVFWTYGAQGVDLEVDVETGHIKVLKVASSFDVGQVVNPQMLEGQLEGAILQGMGTALFEELILKDGKILNKSFVDYKIPTSDDMPELVVSFVENPEETGPFGARGVAEPAMVPTAPAIANAVYNAVGIRLSTMPMTPERVLTAIKEKERQSK